METHLRARSFFLGLTVAALLLLLAGGADQARAAGVVLCKVNKDPCPAGSTYGTWTPLYGGAEATTKIPTEVRFNLPGQVETQCAYNKFVTELSAFVTEPRLGETWIVATSCSASCEVATENFSYKATLAASGGGNGVITVGSPRFHVKCGSSLDCYYGKSTIKAQVKGGEPASLTLEETLERQTPSSFLCPTTATYKGVYQEMLVSPTYISHA
ncbi:MAG TPA: hypothetical protein VJU14_00440 [Solirubrobacterales bacterium]|nr:hypothetical protein [Solirubrobacterales bacterium]